MCMHVWLQRPLKTFYGKYVCLKQPCGLMKRYALTDKPMYLIIGPIYHFSIKNANVKFAYELKDCKPRRRHIQHVVCQKRPGSRY